MKKKGMIPEHHRQSSEDKWAKIIKAIDDGLTSEDGCFPNVFINCGYCEDIDERGVGCRQCYLINKVGCGYKDSHFSRYEQAESDGDMVTARKYAVKIYEYIKNDKPSDKNI